MQPYSVYINENVITGSPKSGKQKKLLMEFIRHLGNNPSQSGDYQDKDNVGHLLEIKIIGRYAITFFADHLLTLINYSQIDLPNISNYIISIYPIPQSTA